MNLLQGINSPAFIIKAGKFYCSPVFHLLIFILSSSFLWQLCHIADLSVVCVCVDTLNLTSKSITTAFFYLFLPPQCHADLLSPRILALPAQMFPFTIPASASLLLLDVQPWGLGCGVESLIHYHESNIITVLHSVAIVRHFDDLAQGAQTYVCRKVAWAEYRMVYATVDADLYNGLIVYGVPFVKRLTLKIPATHLA